MRVSGAGALTGVGTVVAVVAHPDDESFGLGAVLGLLVDQGSRAVVVCLTRGEASTLAAPESRGADLAAARSDELRTAAGVLGVSRTEQLGYPDGGLSRVPAAELTGRVRDVVEAERPSHLLVFDETGVTGHPDHVAATRAAVTVATATGIPVLAWTVPTSVATALNAELGTRFIGRRAHEIDLVVPVDRSLQRRACSAHGSQAVGNQTLRRRLELCGDTEALRWLVPPQATTPLNADIRRRGRS